MATRLVKLRGIAYYPKVFEGNRDLKGYQDALVDVGGQTTIDIDLDDRHVELLKRAGTMSRGNPSPDNPGLTRVKFKRKWQEQYGGGEPKILRADDTTWDVKTDKFIGNGSEVEVTISVYDTKRKGIVGTRLDQVKVLKLVPYEGSSIEVLSVDDLDSLAPAPKAPAQKQMVDSLDGDIPF
jgi:hypothetical protein